MFCVCVYVYIYVRNTTLDKFISIFVLHLLQWLKLTACFMVIATPWSSDLSNWSFFSVIAVFKSVISVTRVIVHTYIRSESAWHMSIDILLRETSLPLPFPTFPPGVNRPQPSVVDWQSTPLALITQTYCCQWLLLRASFPQMYNFPLSGVGWIPLQLICMKLK